MSKKVNYYIGTDQWGTKEWVENFYPTNTSSDANTSSPRTLLDFYSDAFNFLELKSAYHYYDPKMFKKWMNEIRQKPFRVCPWISKIFQFEKNSQLQASRIDSAINDWKSWNENIGPAVFTINRPFSAERKLQLFTLFENLSKSNTYVLNIVESTWRDPSLMNDLFEHSNINSIGIVLNDTEFIQNTTTSFLYLKIDIDSCSNTENLLAKIPTRFDDVYICLIGTDKIKLWQKLKELQAHHASK